MSWSHQFSTPGALGNRYSRPWALNNSTSSWFVNVRIPCSKIFLLSPECWRSSVFVHPGSCSMQCSKISRWSSNSGPRGSGGTAFCSSGVLGGCRVCALRPTARFFVLSTDMVCQRSGNMERQNRETGWDEIDVLEITVYGENGPRSERCCGM